MAQRKSTKSSGKKGAARKKAKPQTAKAARRPAAPQRPARNIKADIAGLVLIALGIFFMACLFQQDAGLLSQSLSEFFRGFLGWGAYGFPLLVAFAGAMVLLYPDVRLSPGVYITLAVVFPLLLCLVTLFATPAMKMVLEDYGYGGFVSRCYEYARAGGASGGALAGMIVFPLLLYLGKEGTIILCVLALCLIAVIWGFSFRAMSRKITEKVDTAVQQRQSARQQKRRRLYVGDVGGAPEPELDLELIDDGLFTLRTEADEEPEDTLEVLKAEDIEVAAPVDQPAPDMHIEVIEPEPEEPEPAPRETKPEEPEPRPLDKPEQVAMEAVIPPEQEGERFYQIPPMSLLEKSKSAHAGDDTAQRARKLEEALHSYGIRADVVGVNCGPVITQFEVQPAPGVKSSSIVNLAQDLAMCLAAPTIRIEAPIPGKSVIGVEIPNTKAAMVRLRDVIETAEFDRAKSPLAFGLGRDIVGKTVIADLAKMPHVLVAGTTGSGKSVCVNTMLISMLYKVSPRDVRLILIDPKVVEMSVYNDIPHMLIPVVTDPQKAAGALKWAVKEMEERYQKFAALKVRDIGRYNEVIEDPALHMPYIVIIIDEMADLMMVAANDVEDSVCRLAQKARAAGMHLVLATQSPRVDVITGMIKANIPSRIALAVSSQTDSRVILDMVGAEKLLGHGDMLYMPIGASKPTRVQGAFVGDEEVERVVEFIRGQGLEEAGGYDEAILDKVENYVIEGDSVKEQGEGRPLDPLLREAVDVVLEQGQASISMVQRRLRVGYARAARLVDEMELLGIVGPSVGSKAREIIKTRAEINNILSEGELPQDG